MIYILNSKNSAFYTLHALGADIWQYIYKDYSYDMILKSLYREYEVEKSVLKADLDSFFNQLYANELLFKEDGEQRDRNSNLGFAEDSLVNNAAEVFDFEVDTYDNIFSLAVNNNTLMCLTIELLDKCNWRCSHCYIPDHINSGFSTKEVFSILDQAHEMGTFEVILTGGEIFLRDDIFDIIIKARSLHMRVYLFTNVSLLDEVK
ncbi:MAG: PqqD family peptide modification chaperone, partial [Candidatus Riflebacteria bacterium]|nr:PqqD family peptide modification chaperone [Candidatus Riflebacteria bacterium]